MANTAQSSPCLKRLPTGTLEHVRFFPHDDPHLDTVGIPERSRRGGRVGEIDDDVHALLLDAERRDLREP